MQWARLLTYVLSPLVLALAAGIGFHLRGIWFVLVVIGGLLMSIVNSIFVSLKLTK